MKHKYKNKKSSAHEKAAASGVCTDRENPESTPAPEEQITNDLNPYAGFVPYERPDYGDSYTSPDNRGRPGQKQRRREKHINISEDSWLNNWYFMLAALLMPYWMPFFMILSFIIVFGLFFSPMKDEKKAGRILLVLCLIKIIIIYTVKPGIYGI